ncbi:MAG TPA: hypothetical protein PKJ42_08870, partial [Candidatus Goldiibacteriota bacterium]|nr:hypothetical protein [Candidatus Goldiibacteriota bacterium]
RPKKKKSIHTTKSAWKLNYKTMEPTMVKQLLFKHIMGWFFGLSALFILLDALQHGIDSNKPKKKKKKR